MDDVLYLPLFLDSLKFGFDAHLYPLKRDSIHHYRLIFFGQSKTETRTEQFIDGLIVRYGGCTLYSIGGTPSTGARAAA